MLSILIPTKDYDCHELIEELHRQGEELDIPYEIIVGEDGTSKKNLQNNFTADILTCCHRVIREKNIGRANIRNVLAVEAKYRNILFIDCDAVVEKKDFLKSYIEALENSDVVCGGLYHTDTVPDKSLSLRFRYEKEADKRRDAATRNLKPYNEFTTFNFAIRRELFMSIFFNTKIIQYGFEDVLFGKELERRRIRILHIDNKLLHNGLEDNKTYISKVEQSIITLTAIEEQIGSTPLLEAAAKLRRWHLKGVFMFAWKAFRHTIIRNLMGEHPSLTLLKIYKLGFYFEVKKKQATGIIKS